jgi:hypothetical protein
VRIAILVEGQTERVFLPYLREFLGRSLHDRMPKLIPHLYNGRINKHAKLKRDVDALLRGSNPVADHVIALTDVYTGSGDFLNAEDAKQKMRSWVGPNERFHPHVALHDFEAWLLPYWPDIQKLAKHNRSAPVGTPESVNHHHPPSYHVKEIFRIGNAGRYYTKTRNAKRILEGKDLSIAASSCPELRAFLNTILTLSGADPL